jgi:hypothetical protein
MRKSPTRPLPEAVVPVSRFGLLSRLSPLDGLPVNSIEPVSRLILVTYHGDDSPPVESLTG